MTGNLKYLNISTLLGLALGTGYLTSYRFIGSVGFSELIIAGIIFKLLLKNYRSFFKFQYDKISFIKFIFLFFTIISLPTATLLTYISKENESGLAPIYIISFIMGVMLLFLLRIEIAAKFIDMRIVTTVFACVFIITNIASITFMPTPEVYDRYSGGANNPNQLLFYSATLSLLLVAFQRKLSIFIFPILIAIMLKTGSDAFGLSIFMMLTFYLYFAISPFKNKKISFRILYHIFLMALIISLSFYFFSDFILEIWLAADEGDARIDLMMNGWLATLNSPIFGHGAGSFSGYIAPFQDSEAHNTFLDLSMQFGFIFPIIIYYIILKCLVASIEKNDYLLSACIIGFIISGLFHFSGRHFVFWVEIAVFLNYIFPPLKNKKNILPL